MNTEQTGTVLSRREVALEFSEEQQAMIRDAYANGATDKEFAVLLEIARARKLKSACPLAASGGKTISSIKRYLFIVVPLPGSLI